MVTLLSTDSDFWDNPIQDQKLGLGNNKASRFTEEHNERKNKEHISYIVIYYHTQGNCRKIWGGFIGDLAPNTVKERREGDFI